MFPLSIIPWRFKTNINGAENVIDAALNNNVETIALSTDKATIRQYMATKPASDKLFIAQITLSEKASLNFQLLDMVMLLTQEVLLSHVEKFIKNKSDFIPI